MNILDFFKKLFTSKLVTDIKKYVAISITVLQSLKDNVDKPGVKNLVDALPGNLDAKVVEPLKNILNKVLPKVMEGNTCLQKTTLVEQFSCFSTMVGGLGMAAKTKIWTGIAFDISVELINAFVGKTVDLNLVLKLIPTLYVDIFGKKTV